MRDIVKKLVLQGAALETAVVERKGSVNALKALLSAPGKACKKGKEISVKVQKL